MQEQKPDEVVKTNASIESPQSRFKVFLKRRNLIIISAISIITLALSSIGAYTFAAWYQNPQKIATDSIVSMIMSKSMSFNGDIDLELGDLAMTISLDSINPTTGTSSTEADIKIKIDDQEFNMKSAYVLSSDGSLYIKLSDFSTIVDSIKQEIAMFITDDLDLAINNLVAEIDDQWIKIGSDDMKTYSDDISTSQTCLSKAANQLSSDKEAMREVADLYDKNRFISIDKELGEVDGRLGFRIGLDEDAYSSFNEGARDLSVYKTFKDCDPNFEVSPQALGLDVGSVAENSKMDMTVEIWADKWSHQMRDIKVDINSPDDNMIMSMDLNINLEDKAAVSAPEKYSTLTDLQDYIMQFMYDASGYTEPIDNRMISI